MLTVADLQRDRQAKALVNHETYKQLLHQVQRLLRTRADNRGTDLLWPVPPLVPGRPLYTVSHAARYVAEKLRRGGFQVLAASPQPGVHVLYITWSVAPPKDGQRTRRQRRDDDSNTTNTTNTTLTNASRSLEKLKARLRVS